jgi:hypothetical protein
VLHLSSPTASVKLTAGPPVVAPQAYIRSVQSCLAVRPKVILSQWCACSKPCRLSATSQLTKTSVGLIVDLPQVLPLPRH